MAQSRTALGVLGASLVLAAGSLGGLVATLNPGESWRELFLGGISIAQGTITLEMAWLLVIFGCGTVGFAIGAMRFDGRNRFENAGYFVSTVGYAAGFAGVVLGIVNLVAFALGIVAASAVAFVLAERKRRVPEGAPV